jgi:hypothetical protein
VDTETNTPEDTATETATLTLSETASVSPTETDTGTPTLTLTVTFTPTLYLSPTITLTPTPLGQPNAGPGKSYCYPQPAHDWLRIVYSLPAAETVAIKIYNFAGIPVDSETDIGAASDANMKEIDIKKYAPGIYFYLIKRSGVLPMTGKFLVVK